MMKAVVKVFLFAVIVIAVLFSLSKPFRDNNGYEIRMKAFYKLKESPMDIVVFGNSHGLSSFNPVVINAELGATTFNLSQSGQKLPITYFYIKEAIRVNKPGMVVLELFNTRSEDGPKVIPLNILSVRAMEPSINKLNATVSYFEPKYYLETLFPAIGNHDLWHDPDDFAKNFSDQKFNPYPYLSGFYAASTTLSLENFKKFDNSEAWKDGHFTKLENEQVEELEKIIQLCKEEDVKLVFVIAPMVSVFLRNQNYEEWASHLSEIAQKNEVPLCDLNVGYKEEDLPRLLFANEVNSYHHVNKIGALYSSKELSTFIQKNVGFEAKTSDSVWLETNMVMPEFFLLDKHVDRRGLPVVSSKRDGLEIIYDYKHKNAFLKTYKVFDQLKKGPYIIEFFPADNYQDHRNLLKGNASFITDLYVNRPSLLFPHEADIERVNFPKFPVKSIRVYPKSDQNLNERPWEIILEIK